MIGKDENQEEVSFKVADRRKFNADGSLKDGVTLDPSPAPKIPEQTPPAAPEPARQPADQRSHAEQDLDNVDENVDELDDGPGADDPASFVNFLSTLATNAAAALGAIPHPATGKRGLDLDTGKYWLEVLGMIREKTKGNLHPQEDRLLNSLLGDLRMQYVQVVKATEEQLKAQAAKKFSAADVLGKK